jgi:hypothetical protein
MKIQPKDVGAAANTSTTTLTDGRVVAFREPKVRDIRELDNAGYEKNVEMSVRLCQRICIQWGDKPGVTLQELDELNLADFKRVSEAIAGFLADVSQLG